jgi:hypothetical protein
MAILQPGLTKTYQLQPGETLSITTDANSICRYAQLLLAVGGSAVGEQPIGTPIAVPANSAITVGPRGDVSRWLIDGIVGPGVNVTQNPASSVPDFAAPPDVMHAYGAGAPAATFAQNQAQTGSLYTDTTNGKLYINSGTKAAVSWRLVTSA